VPPGKRGYLKASVSGHSGEERAYLKMQTDRKENIRRSWIWIGFGIGASVSLFANVGIFGLLFLIDWFQLPEEELTIFTSLFYGIVFFIALGGVRAENRRYKMLVTRDPYETPSPPESPARKRFRRIRTVLWYAFGSFSLGWLTPVMIIYWAELKDPHQAVTICAFLFSLAAGTAYVLKHGGKIRTRYDYIVLYVGVCLGALLVQRIMGVVPL
jgi:hypothetical protein